MATKTSSGSSTSRRSYDPGKRDQAHFPMRLGPFVGGFDASDPGAATPNRLFQSLNMMLPDAVNGAGVWARHGMVGFANRLTYTNVQGAVQATGQGIYTFRALNGTIYNFVFCGGRMYQWDGNDADFPGTDVTPNTVTIDATNPVFCCYYNDQLVVSDETNVPWVFTPATGAASLIDIDGTGIVWTTKGGPVVYSGKVFFILRAKGANRINTDPVSGEARIATDGDVFSGGLDLTSELSSGFQNTAVWCEELQPTVGYMQTNYTDYWTLTQSSGEVLGALAADEGGLVYLRNTGIGLITGAVNSDFQTSATRDPISTTVGTDAPAACCFVDRTLYFVDMDGRPYRLVPATGSAPEPLWFPVRRAVESNVDQQFNRATVVANARATYHAEYQMVLMTIWDQQTIYGFDAVSGRYIGQWTVNGTLGSSAYVDAMGSYTDIAGRHTFALLGSRANIYSTTTNGVFWRQKFASDTNQWLDEPTQGGATVALTRTVEPQWLTSSGTRSYQLFDMTAQVGGDAVSHSVGAQYVTPNNGASSVITAQSTAVVGDVSSTDAVSTCRWGFGGNAQGTALRVKVVCTHSDNVRFGLHNIDLEGRVLQARIGGR